MFFRNLTVFLSAAIPVVLIVFTAVGFYTNGSLIFYAGIGISGILAIILSWILINFILVMFFPKSNGFAIRRILERLGSE